MAQEGYQSCSGCGLMFKIDSEKEQALLTTHDCESEPEEEEEEENKYLSYSMDSLEVIAQKYALMLGGGQTTLGNGDNLGEAYQQVCEAIAEREKTDYCIHGNFKWDEVLCHGCEME